MTHTIKGRPLCECSNAELVAEFDAGSWLDCQEGLSPEQERRLQAIEREMAQRDRFKVNVR